MSHRFRLLAKGIVALGVRWANDAEGLWTRPDRSQGGGPPTVGMVIDVQ